MTPPRLVLDTNVLLSTLLFHAGTMPWLRHAWQPDTIIPLASRDTTAELIRVLHYPKFRLTHDEREDLLGACFAVVRDRTGTDLDQGLRMPRPLRSPVPGAGAGGAG